MRQRPTLLTMPEMWPTVRPYWSNVGTVAAFANTNLAAHVRKGLLHSNRWPPSISRGQKTPRLDKVDPQKSIPWSKSTGSQLFTDHCRTLALKKHVLSRSMRDPKITLAGFSVSRIEIPDWRFINLKIGPSHHPFFNLPVNRLEPFAD